MARRQKGDAGSAPARLITPGNEAEQHPSPAQPERNSLIVLGMHRSGTSALTGFLRLCGAWVGEEEALTGAAAENPKGFWERRDVRNICDALLHSAGADWWRVTGFDTMAVPHTALSGQGRRFREIVGELDRRGTWVLKEPRLCLLFPLLRPYITSPVCLHIYRHPVEVAQSLRTRNGFGLSEGLALWEAYTQSALRASEGLPRLLVSYEKLASGDHSEAGRIVEQLRKMGVTGLTMPAQDMIDGFLTPDLHRQKAMGDQALEYMLPSQRELWSRLEGGDALQVEPAEMLPVATRQHLRDLESRMYAAEAQQARARTLEDNLGKAKSHAGALNDKLKAERDRGNRLSAELKEAHEQIRERDVLLAERAKQAQARENELDEARKRIVQLDEDARKQIRERDARVDQLARQAQAYRQANDKIRASRSWRMTAPLRGANSGVSWLGRNTRRSAQLAGWLATGQFGRAATASRPYLRKLIPTPLQPRSLRQSQMALPEALARPGTRPATTPPGVQGAGPEAQAGAPSRLVLQRGELGQPLNFADVAETETSWWYRLHSSRLTLATSREATLSVAGTTARIGANPEPPAVLVPVYNAVEETEDCLRSLLSHTNLPCRILVIDDASPDPRVREMLERYHGQGSIEVFRNPENLGFTRTVNRGIELAGRADVVFLNSDTMVTPGWLRNLRFAAYSGDKVATATPLSNNAGAFSAPEPGKENEIPAHLGLDSYGRAISQVTLRLYPQVPTGNGFCLYVRRDCIDEIGALDAEAFPRGYGEENDFCMRAGQNGWTHVIDDATLIYHVRSASFSGAKAELLKQGRSVIDARYPHYKEAVGQFAKSDSLKLARQRVADVISHTAGHAASVRPRILYVLSSITGGTPQTNQDLIVSNDDRIEAFILRSDSSTMTLLHFIDGSYVSLETHKLSVPLKAFPHRSDEYDEIISSWLMRYAIELVHVRSIIWHGTGLIDSAKRLGIPVVFSFHDYYAICPTVKLVDDTETYCGGRCTPSRGECKPELWDDKDFPPLKHAAVYDWQSQMSSMLKECDAFVTTQKSAKDIITDIYGFLDEKPFPVIPHGRDFDSLEQIAETVDPDGVIRLVVPGNISRRKGARIVAEISELFRDQELEIHILGKIARDAALPKNVINHGEYRRDEFGLKLRAIRPHIGGIFSIWPETYCHTLTELWASGVPVIGFDFGAVGERIRESGAGWLPSTPTARDVAEIINGLRRDPQQHAATVSKVLAWQQTTARQHTRRNMSDAYLALYEKLTKMEQSTDATELR